MGEKRTTKRVTMTITATFYGDYVAADETAMCLQNWMDSGFNDRDDLRCWDFGPAEVTEIDGDPDGYDS